MREWISRREEKAVYHQLVKELELEDHAAYGDFLCDKRAPLRVRNEQPFPINT